MKNDIQLKHNVEEELQWDPAMDASRFAVQAKDGVITLSGGVDTFADRHAAEEATRRIAGVIAPVIHVDMWIPSDMERLDGEIAQAISSALHWNVSMPPNAAQITVEGGTVALRGEVDQDFQRRAAPDTVRRVRGVRSVANALTLCAVSGPTDLSDRIAKALQCLTAVDASRLSVSVTDGTVTLYGPLRNLNECRAAREAAWDVPDMRTVVDQMWVGS